MLELGETMSVERFFELIDGDFLEAKGRLMNDAFIKSMLLKFADWGHELEAEFHPVAALIRE